eukprot:2221013-Pleurochrysis_carterae.AAC.1
MRDWACSQAEWRGRRAHAHTAVTLHEVARAQEGRRKRASARITSYSMRAGQHANGGRRHGLLRVKAGRE